MSFEAALITTRQIIDSLNLWWVFNVMIIMAGINIGLGIVNKFFKPIIMGRIEEEANAKLIYYINSDGEDLSDEKDEEIENKIIQRDILTCSYCNSPNISTALHCDKCGAPLRR